MTTCETCNDTHSMSLRGSLVPCTRCPTPCQECRINGRGAYCAKTPCACACHDIVDRPSPTPALGLDLDAAEKRAAGFRGAFRAMSYDSGDEMLEFVSDGADPTGDVDEIAQFACDDDTQRAIVATLNEAPALIAEVRAARAKVEALTAEQAAARGTVGECRNSSPAGFTGHWRDWHRGHGCDKDPERGGPLPKGG